MTNVSIKHLFIPVQHQLNPTPDIGFVTSLIYFCAQVIGHNTKKLYVEMIYWRVILQNDSKEHWSFITD